MHDTYVLGNECVRKRHLKINYMNVFCLPFSDHKVCCNPLTFRWFHKGLAWKQTKHGDLLVDDGDMNT